MKKSFLGYLLAFFIAIIVWYAIERLIKDYLKGEAKPYWIVLQWITSGTLWAVWIMQDAANIAVFLPRQLSVWEFVTYAGFVFIGIGFLFYVKGARIQSIVNEKSDVTDVRAATIVDFVYAIILFYFKLYSNVPMSTTWVFIGLLGGRELAIALGKVGKEKKRKAWVFRAYRLAKNDVGKAFIGLLVSLILAIVINEGVRNEILEMLKF
jgi:hypothetical protein